MSTASLLAALSTDVGTWYEDGSCVQEGGADSFFSRQGELDGGRREADAKAHCASCPVLASCFEWALAAGDPSGVWAGGTSTSERLARHRELALAS